MNGAAASLMPCRDTPDIETGGAMPSPRRFPPPWTIDEHTESFIVRDATGQALGYFYSTMNRSAARRPIGLPKTRRGFSQRDKVHAKHF